MDAGKARGEKRVDERVAIVFDVKQMRPACALLQAALGGNHRVAAQLFDADLWLLTPNPNMKLYLATIEEWRIIAKRVGSKMEP